MAQAFGDAINHTSPHQRRTDHEHRADGRRRRVAKGFQQIVDPDKAQQKSDGDPAQRVHFGGDAFTEKERKYPRDEQNGSIWRQRAKVEEHQRYTSVASHIATQADQLW